jgi:hypothetical protein
MGCWRGRTPDRGECFKLDSGNLSARAAGDGTKGVCNWFAGTWSGKISRGNFLFVSVPSPWQFRRR